KQVLRRQVDDSAKARNKVNALESNLIESKVSKIRERPSLRLAIKIPSPGVRVGRRGNHSRQHHPRSLQRVALPSLIAPEGSAWGRQQVLGVHGKMREEQQRGAVGRCRDINEGTIGITGGDHQRRQRAGSGFAKKLLGYRLGVEVGCGLHPRTSPYFNQPYL